MRVRSRIHAKLIENHRMPAALAEKYGCLQDPLAKHTYAFEVRSLGAIENPLDRVLSRERGCERPAYLNTRACPGWK